MRDLTTRLVPLGDLEPHPENANVGDVPAVRESLRRYGQWRPVVAQVRDGAPLRVLIGHTMLRAAQAEGWDRIAVHEREVSDDEARRILAIDNRTRDLADTDERALVRLLSSLGDDLSGTAYALDDLDDLRALVEEQEAATLRNLRENAAADEAERPAPQVRTTPSQKSYLDAYDGKGTRHMALIYPVAPYVWLIDRLERIAGELGVESNAEVVLALVERHLDEQAPAMNLDDEPPAAADLDDPPTIAEPGEPDAAPNLDPAVPLAFVEPEHTVEP